MSAPVPVQVAFYETAAGHTSAQGSDQGIHGREESDEGGSCAALHAQPRTGSSIRDTTPGGSDVRYSSGTAGRQRAHRCSAV